MYSMSGATDDYSPHHLRSAYQVTDEDLDWIRKFGAAALPHVEDFVGAFYEWLEPQPVFEEFFPDDSVLVRVRDLQVDYWVSFFQAEIDDQYVRDRRRVGETHARIGLPLHSYFSAMNMSLRYLTEDMARVALDPADYAPTIGGVTRLTHLDTGIVVQAYTEMVNETMAAQSRSLMELSTPVTRLWSDIIMLPVVGIIDSKRAQDIMNASLESIAETQARYFILDISGVAVVDTAVASHIFKITRATALMGCECIISGISPAIAQTMIELGIDVGTVRTTANMKDALAMAFQKQGLDPSTEG